MLPAAAEGSAVVVPVLLGLRVVVGVVVLLEEHEVLEQTEAARGIALLGLEGDRRQRRSDIFFLGIHGF